MALLLLTQVLQGHTRLIQARLQNLRRVGKDFDLGHAGYIRTFSAGVKIGGMARRASLPQRRWWRLRYPHGERVSGGGSGAQGYAAFLQNARVGRGGTQSVALGWYTVSRWDTGRR